MAKRKTGLGAEAFFTTPETVETASEPEEKPESTKTTRKQQKKEEPQGPKHIRTTIRLHTETFAALEMLKVQARKQGEKITFGDILDEAIKDLMEKKGVTV